MFQDFCTEGRFQAGMRGGILKPVYRGGTLVRALTMLALLALGGRVGSAELCDAACAGEFVNRCMPHHIAQGAGPAPSGA